MKDETKESTHTKEELVQNGANGIHTKEGHCIAITYGENGLDRKANAKRLVKAWNMHDELLRRLKMTYKILAEQGFDKTERTMSAIDSTIKKAEQE